MWCKIPSVQQFTGSYVQTYWQKRILLYCLLEGVQHVIELDQAYANPYRGKKVKKKIDVGMEPQMANVNKFSFRRFVCEVCERAFTDCSTLRKHRMIHTTEKNFLCEVKSVNLVPLRSEIIYSFSFGRFSIF